MINMAHREDAKERFSRNFRIQQSNIQEQIIHLPSIAPVAGERQDATEHILTNISRLTNDVRDATHFLPAYDHRVYVTAVSTLRKELDETTAKLAPKSRFQFRPRPERILSQTAPDSRRLVGATARDGGSSPGGAKGEEKTNGKPPISPPLSPGNGRGRSRSPRAIRIEDESDAIITLPADHSRASSAGQLTSLSNCVVNLSAPTVEASRASPFASLALRDVSNSVIIAGHVDGPVHVTNLKRCKVVVSSRQVRIHECAEVDFYLWVRSEPIIEGCRQVRFAPMPQGLEGGEQGGNKWEEVKDFLWLKQGEQSPNWSVLPEDERIGGSIWREVMDEGSKEGVKEVLGRFEVV
ncbi:tubulin binding cofactor C-domain-containing protein [Triangularia verruculosa]|uniref:Tubulin binding cofactor C-domain-containing protein n=1 Tax=Triangularia verruculosa TaxID=2587418 RepID=A0AAN6X8H9_9PEZI|nr:tubulin binding cofactor C-domain-containing protein [Triangularia verruculosa]